MVDVFLNYPCFREIIFFTVISHRLIVSISYGP